MPRADDVLALDGAADPHVGAEVLAVRVQHMHFAGLGAKQHHLLAEVMHPLDAAGRQIRGEADDEPSGRETVGRQADAGRAEFPFRWVASDGSTEESENRIRHWLLLLRHSAPANWRTAALTLAALVEDFVYFYYFKH